MNNQIIVIMCCVITLLSMSQVRAESWIEPTSLLGNKIDSTEFKFITQEYGSVSYNTSDSKIFIDFESKGITFVSVDNRIIEIIFQIAPGKRIKDVSFMGSLPNNVIESQESPEKAMQLLGQPVSDNIQEGYRNLTYLINDKFLTLYYGPSLDFVSIKLR